MIRKRASARRPEPIRHQTCGARKSKWINETAVRGDWGGRTTTKAKTWKSQDEERGITVHSPRIQYSSQTPSRSRESSVPSPTPLAPIASNVSIRLPCLVPLVPACAGDRSNAKSHWRRGRCSTESTSRPELLWIVEREGLVEGERRGRDDDPRGEPHAPTLTAPFEGSRPADMRGEPSLDSSLLDQSMMMGGGESQARLKPGLRIIRGGQIWILNIDFGSRFWKRLGKIESAKSTRCKSGSRAAFATLWNPKSTVCA
ncbi:hypothetical protein DFP72DRAFT_1119659 [Ephemerocybe angulata]|uniref:Uncharacterized protein n=1 Tax=Ephemerocybe angulata TaxID=980116 RepID=A0A8H6M4S1_9AGAR|nr:hypothetical protein DFP72DRAFT_1119659 [Tulosesus angulatus]